MAFAFSKALAFDIYDFATADIWHLPAAIVEMIGGVAQVWEVLSQNGVRHGCVGRDALTDDEARCGDRDVVSRGSAWPIACGC